MKTDELRAELRRISDEMEPFEGDLLSVHRSVRRYRAVWGVVAAAAMVALVVGALAIAHRTSQPNVSKQVPDKQLQRVDVIVVPDTPAVRAIVDNSPLVDAYARIAEITPGSDHAPAFHGPSVDAACALQHDDGLALEATRGRGDITDALRVALGKKAQVFDISHNADAEIFMKVAAANEQIANIRAALSRDSAVASFAFVDHNAALAEFRQVFKDQPGLIASTKASDLPESFRLTLVHARSEQDLVAHYQNRAGVDTVITHEPFSLSELVNTLPTNQTSCSTP